MSNEQKNLEQNALATKLTHSWANFKQGKLIGYRWMAILLLVTAGIGVTLYIRYENRKGIYLRWMSLDDASTPSALEEVSKSYPNTIQDRIARLDLARHFLGRAGLDQLRVARPEDRKKAVENVEKAREMFQQLVEDFKNDPVLKPQCLLAQAKAEAALVVVPTKEGQLTEFKGTIPKVVELLDQVADSAAPDTPWATDAKKIADKLRDPKLATTHEFFRVQQELFTIQPAPKIDFPGMEGMGGMPGTTLPILPGGRGRPSFPSFPGPISP